MGGTLPARDLELMDVDALKAEMRAIKEDAAISNLLLGLGVALSEVKSVEDTIHLSVKLVPDVLGADRCFAVVANPRRVKFDLKAHFGFDEAGVQQLNDLAQKEGGLPFVERSLKEGRISILGDVWADPESKRLLANRPQIRGYVCIPLARWGQDIGVLGVEFDEPQEFTATEEGIVRVIARQIAMALANARRFELLGELSSFGMRLGSKLALEDVAAEVVSGTQELLDAMVAAMYFVDTSQKAMVPIDTGLSGREVDALLPGRLDLSTEPWDRLLFGEIVATTGQGGRANLVAVPITKVGVGTIGAISAFLTRPLPLGPEEEEALTVLASLTVLAIETASLFEQQRRVAHTLQQGLISTKLPETPGFDIGAVYEPAGGEMDIGGDFYDVFEVWRGTFAVVVGDVSGKGAEAAAQTSMAKYMLRAFAIRNAAPTSVLYQLNNALVDGFSDERFATLFYALLETDARRLQVATAGHPEPLVFRAATQHVEVLRPKGGILGSFPSEQFAQVDVSIEPGDVILAYTDGLVEARDGNDLYGLERLMESLATLAPSSSDAKELARALYEDAAKFGSITDDTVVLVIAARD